MYRVFVTAGLIGRLAWLGGNVAEARGREIERWADDPPASVLTPGRPPFFYALTGPPTVVATAGACWSAWRPATVAPRAATAFSVGSTAAALGTTALMVRTVVLPLRAGTADRDVAVRRWYRLNRVRMLLVLAAVVTDVRVLLGP